LKEIIFEIYELLKVKNNFILERFLFPNKAHHHHSLSRHRRIQFWPFLLAIFKSSSEQNGPKDYFIIRLPFFFRTQLQDAVLLRRFSPLFYYLSYQLLHWT